MRLTLWLVLLPIVFSISSCSTERAESKTPDEPAVVPAIDSVREPVLVELFTSEGCSSCPPADRALILLEKQQPVNGADSITLEFHVDYWDGPGWKDPFSSALFTQRQEQYAAAFKLDSDYTPQMIVDGQQQFVGSELGQATKTIQKLATQPKGKIEGKIDGESLKISLSALPTHEQSTIYLATAEDNLVSRVSGGENGGSTLSHTSVVRELKPVGTIEKSSDKLDLRISPSVQPGWKNDRLRYVVFVQENASRKVIAIGRVTK